MKSASFLLTLFRNVIYYSAVPNLPVGRAWLAAPSRRGWPRSLRQTLPGALESVGTLKSCCRKTRHEQPQENARRAPARVPARVPVPAVSLPLLSVSISPERPASVSWLRDSATNTSTGNLPERLKSVR